MKSKIVTILKKKRFNMISKGENIFSSSQKSLNLAKDTHK